tara:strand:- start:9595 stop:10017 length:423 start_codon:yes stop_codon:yes gene_type:complete
MDQKKKDYKNEALEIINQKMQFFNYADSFGILLLRNGFVLHVGSFFEYFREYWNDYQDAVVTGNEEKKKNLMKETGGGILTNGQIDVDIKEVIATIAIYKLAPFQKGKKNPFESQVRADDNPIINDDNIGEFGDSIEMDI